MIARWRRRPALRRRFRQLIKARRTNPPEHQFIKDKDAKSLRSARVSRAGDDAFVIANFFRFPSRALLATGEDRRGESAATSTRGACASQNPLIPDAEAQEIARVLERWRASLPGGKSEEYESQDDKRKPRSEPP